MFLSLILTSLLLIQATTVPQTHKELDDEMRGYVRHSAEVLGRDPNLIASHVTSTLTLASSSYFRNGWSSFHIITFDTDYIKRQPTHIKKAMAAHEVGHSYYPCAVMSRMYKHGLATYLEKENCADVASVVVYGLQPSLESLKAIRAEFPRAISIDDRIKLLEIQLGGIPEIDDEDLTYWDE